jgi:hypothetical protein
MRPKIVILTLVTAFGLLGIIAMFKGVMKPKSVDGGGPAPGAEASLETPSATTNAQFYGANLNSSNKAPTDEQIRDAVVNAEVLAIQDTVGQADGTNNPVVIAALIGKFSHEEPEVRKAALDGLIQLNDTNAVPAMEQSLAAIKDPREKVAVLDAIEYLKLPSMTDNIPPEDLTNSTAKNIEGMKPRPVQQINPGKRGGGQRAQPRAPANPNAGPPR